MLRGLYHSASAMLAYQARHEAISTNLVNTNTTGYKAVRPALGSFGRIFLHRLAGGRTEAAVGPLGTDVAVVGSVTDLAGGPLRETREELDLALQGEGFFSVQTAGGVRYTRAGEFGRDARGRLVTPQGWLVLGVNGAPITVGDEAVHIEPDGRVFAGSDPAGRLALVSFAAPEFLAREDSGLFAPTESSGGPQPAEPLVLQGFVEGANVDTARQMADLLSTVRAFEASQKALEAQDETLRLAVNELAKF